MILLIEDDLILQTLTKTILEDHNYEVVIASTGDETIEQYLKYEDQIQLVFMDIIMGTYGMTTIDKLRSLNPQVKIIVTSGLESNRELATTADENVKAFLLKPYTAGELIAVIYEVMSMS